MNTQNRYPLTPPVSEMDHCQGSKDALVTLVEYGDYQCPYCGQAYPIVKKLQEEFGDKLEFVFRNFPLTEIHEYSFHAAESSEIADEYGKFWEMHDMLYQNQDNLQDDNLIMMASKLGIDSEEFSKKLQAEEKAKKVKDDFMSGVESGVNGTPSFYINGYKYEGPWDYENLKSAIVSTIL